MDLRYTGRAAFGLIVWLAGLQGAVPADVRQLREAFAKPPADARILMRWWWFGPAVTKSELESEMRLMKEAGIGGFEVQPVYPLALDDPGQGIRNLPFLSPEFLDALRFTSRMARELGLRMDLTLGSGWPFGGPAITRDLAAGRLRCERVAAGPGERRVALPPLSPEEKLIAAFLADGQTIRRLELPSAGPVTLPPDAGSGGAILFFISSQTGMMVKRAAVGAEGPVLDHYSRAALDRYLRAVGDPLLAAVGSDLPGAVFCDSLEVFGSDWTRDFPAEFRKRRGYDLIPHLPSLVGDGGDAGAIRHDWGLTLTELAEENFLIPLQDWARRHGTRLRIQAYGTPPVALSSNRLVDLPEGEGSFWNRFTSTRWATSAGHLFGRNVISSETWTWLHSPAFRATPLDLKAEADRHFLQGVNQLVGHGWPYSPEAAGEPGWRLYAAAALNHHNPWWIVMPDLALYLQRLSFLLRQGRPVNDVALYLPVSDARAAAAPGRVSINDALQNMFGRSAVIPRILEAGYGFDFVDDVAISEHSRPENGSLNVNGARYAVVVLPNVERIPVETYRKLEEFVRGGGKLIATRRAPSRAPGFLEAEARGAEVRELSRRLFDGPATLVQTDDELSSRLTGVLTPDVLLSAGASQVGFVHRTTSAAEIYFLANTGNSRVCTRATFRVRGMRPELWDPLTGEARPVVMEPAAGAKVTVALDFEPYQSLVVVFAKDGVSKGANPPAPGTLPAPVDLSRDWEVTFEGSGVRAVWDRLRSWTDDPQTRFYSGQVTYEKKFAVKEAWLRRGLAWRLDFGEGAVIPETPATQPGMRAWLESPVREAAVVYVNGARAGSVWCPPYRVEVSRHLRPGENTIRVVAGNLAINRMAGSPPPDYGPLNRRYGKRFDPQDMDSLRALPSGLLGPVRLTPAPETARSAGAAQAARRQAPAGTRIGSKESSAGVGAGVNVSTREGARKGSSRISLKEQP